MTEDFDDIKINLDGEKTLYENSVKKVINRKDVEKYAIDLDALEVSSLSEKKDNMKKNKEDDVWQNLDVKLSEILNSFIATSERPVFLIRDDKLVYINQAALTFFDIDYDKDFIGNNFFNMVIREDWALLSENIGEMLINSKEIKVRIKNIKGKITSANLRAIYLPESDHFSFILFGEHKKQKDKVSFGSLRDDKTGLPNFFLFEDRVQVAIRDAIWAEKNGNMLNIAIIALNIDNIESFKNMHIDGFIVNKVIEALILSLPKNSTIAAGIKYNFWLMLKAESMEEINKQLARISEVLKTGVRDNFTEHKLIFSIGVSLFPHNSRSSKTLMEQAIKALEKNQKNNEYLYDFFVEETF